jgi:hypothetical protein
MIVTQKQLKIQKFWKKYPKLITRELRDIIHGYVMSDGYIAPGGRLEVEQSKQQAKFVEWLYDKLVTIRTETPILETIRWDKRTNKATFSRSFYTKCLLKGFHAMWYKRNVLTIKPFYIKVLPKSINALMSPTVLTLWFAGDGTKRKGRSGCSIESTCFTTEERLVLQSLLARKFQLDTKITKGGSCKSGTKKWSIAFNTPVYPKFRKLITQIDLIERIFAYKLHPVLTILNTNVIK